MTEIKKTLEILKSRWPEVALIIGIGTLSLFYNKLLYLVPPNITTLQKLVDLSWFFAFIVVIELLITGFQRTLYLEGPNRQSTITLLRVGAHFFWRMLVFGLIYLLVYWILAKSIYWAMRSLLPVNANFWETAKAASFIYKLCFTASSSILIKPLLFIFPLIVVLDCRLFKSFKLLKHCKLLEAIELVILFLISTLITYLWAFLPSIESASTVPKFTLLIVATIAQGFIGLMTAVMAVRFVASQNLVYDNVAKPLDSQY